MSAIQEGVVVFGAGGHAKVIIATLLAAKFNVVAAVDDDEKKWERHVLGIPVIGRIDDWTKSNARFGVIAIGNNATRRQISQRTVAPAWLAVVHPAAFVHESVSVGPGAVVLAGAVIQPDARVGAHVIVNTAATIDHDCEIDDFAHLAPGVHLAGDVRVKTGAMLGTGAIVTPGRCIGEWSTLGAGSVAIRDIPGGVTAVGAPATILGVQQ
jgi:sugar O-acyltransferase (sialic acid O-acetyltransferase NeuD family)